MTAAAAAWRPEPATSTGVRRYDFEAIPTVERGSEFGTIIELNTFMGPITTAGPDRTVAAHGTTSGPANETGAPVRQSTAEAVLEIRRRSGLTWESLSELFNVSRRSVHHWANGRTPSTRHEMDIRRTLDAVRHIDEGNQRATRDRLLATFHGTSLFEMLADRRYADVLQQEMGAASIVSGRQLAALSEDEWARRRPTRPDRLLESIQDRPEIPATAARIVRPARRKNSRK